MESIQLTTSSGKNICYRKSGAGPYLVLLHGFPEDNSLWDMVIPGIEQEFGLIIPDLPGAGKSDLQEDTSMESLAESIKQLLDHEQADTVVMAGHSMGGYVTMAFADLYPEYLKGYALVHSTATADTEEKKEIRRKAIALIQKGGKEPFVKGMIPNLFGDWFKAAHPEIIEKQIARSLLMSAESMISFYNCMINRPDRTNVLSDRELPVQWIIGKEDNVVPLQVALQQSGMSVVNFVEIYEHTGHMSMIERPERLAGDLRKFTRYCLNR